MKEVFLVINPVAYGGRVETIWEDQIKPLVDKYDLEYDFEFTSSPQHAIEIARTRVNEGYKIICSVGGDGTANEVLNGILKAEKTAIFSAIPVGTGDDIPTVYGANHCKFIGTEIFLRIRAWKRTERKSAITWI